MDKKEITKRIAFAVMSDGTLTQRCVNASFAMSMKTSNEDFGHYIGEAFDELGLGYKVRHDSKYFHLTTKTHPFLTKMRERIYPQDRKDPSPHDFKLLDWEALAILYMCDGSIQKSGKRFYPMLNLCQWNYAELQWVSHQLKERLGLPMTVYSCGKKYWRLGATAANADRFFEGVHPHIQSSFLYKLPYGKPH